MEAPVTTTHPVPDLDEPPRLNLRAEFVEAYGPQVFLALSIAGTMFLLPFAISHFLQGHVLLGSASTLVGGFIIVNALAIAMGHRPPFNAAFIFAPALVALAVAMRDQGLIGILWSYAALLLFHFVLPRRTANLFNATIVLVAVPMSWAHLGPEITARVAVTLGLTLLFTNIFSYVADAQRRKEMEQRHRLDLVVRGTNAGTLEWDSDGRVHFSRRLKQMMERPGDADTAGWDFFSLVHPEDRERVRAHVLSQLATRGEPRRVRHQPPDDYRLLLPSGDPVWVHTEGIAVTDARGRTSRYICSFMDITEQMRAQDALLSSHERVRAQAAQLEAQNKALREAIRVREEVERIARHDLKTPLASIASVPRMLRDGRRLDAREEELLGMVEHAAKRVLSMVNLSLDLFRMEEGSYRLRPQAVDLAALVVTVARELAGHADSKQVAVRHDLPAVAIPARGEELLCYSILANLMKNAVEASPEGAAVTVTLEAPAAIDGVVLRIHNRGAVPQALRERFFQKYATHGKADGTGLGAYSARLMARVQQGDLQMRTSDAEGTTLTLWLPRWREPDAPRPDAAAQVQQPLAPRPAGAGAAGIPSGSVLLVDDDPYNVMVLRSLLPSPPLHVDVAINGRAALQCAERRRPDIVFLDLQMPVMGGMETIGRLRELQRERGQAPSRVVAFSASDDDVSRQQCADAGFDHYLVKPASHEEVLALLGAEHGAVAALDPVEAEVMALMPEFIASRVQLVDDLCRAARRGERDKVHALAHMLAGSFPMYGFRRAGDLSRDIEKRAPGEALPLLHERCLGLERQFHHDLEALALQEQG